MKIFSVSQIKAWDAFTIEHRPIKYVRLMEWAAEECSVWIRKLFPASRTFKIFCGKGNNGGDGLAIARLLKAPQNKVSVYIISSSSNSSPDFEINLNRLKKTSVKVHFLEDGKSFPALSKNDLIIDAIFGTGLNKKPEGIFSDLIFYINQQDQRVISIDVPSGLFVDKSSAGNPVIKASFTLSFQNMKFAFLMPENAGFIGEVKLLDIGLSKEFVEKENSNFYFVDEKIISEIYTPRKKFSNKSNYGFASLLAGSYGMMGAAVLASRACLRSGVGKLTSITCQAGYTIVQTAVPEAMCRVSGETFIKDVKEITDFDVIGIGPGIGKYPSHRVLLQILFENKKPLVIDADALNVLSQNPELYPSIPVESILTPHPKEFERLFGKSDSDFDRIQLALKKSKELNVFIILKGHYTFIASPDGQGFFNSTGNAGMATAGSGDVLTGILTGLMAQKYSSLHSCILGVYLHGLAGDLAAENLSQEALIADDIVLSLGGAFQKISR